jgi:diguanylate cyclase (GGDEF)-like protein/PAS domain S-box-containing protein
LLLIISDWNNLTLFSTVPQIKSPSLLFSLYFIIFSAVATEITSEVNLDTDYQSIRNNTSISFQEKENSYTKLLEQVTPFENKRFEALIINQLHYNAILQGDTVNAQRWLDRFKKNLNQIISKKSLLALNLLLKKNQLLELQNDQQHLPALKISLALFNQMNNVIIKKNNSILNDDVYLTNRDVAEINNLTGISYFSIGDYDQAQQYFITSLRLYEDLQALQGVAAALNNLSLISWAQKDFHAALKYLERPIEISQQLNDSALYIINISNQGIYYTELKQFENAIISYKKAINHPDSKYFPKETLGAIIGLADAYITINELTLAKKQLEEALQLTAATKNKKSQISAEGFIGDIYLLQGEPLRALAIYNRALLYYQETKLQQLEAETYKRISKAYQAQKKWQQAFNFYEKHILLINKLNDEAQQKSIRVLQNQYKAEVKQKKINLLQAENQLQTLELQSAKSQSVVTIVISLFSLIILLLTVNRHYIRKERVRLTRHNNEIRANEEQLMLLSIAFKNTADAVWITNKDFEIEVVNNAYVTHTHKHKSEVIGQKVVFAEINGQPADLSEKLRAQAMVHGSWLGELFDQKSTGEIYSLELEIEAITNDNNEIIHYLGVFRDITEKVKIQQQLSKLATHDDLTELPNRTLLHELIVQSSLNSQRSQKSPTVLLLDVNSFKKINDTYGHSAGDEVIREIADRLSTVLYPKDVIARINGAEFCILVELSDPNYGAIAVARKILSCFDTAYIFDDHQLPVTASIGITRYPEDADVPQELLRKAALAIFDIKAQKKNNYQFFEQRMNSEVAEQLAQEQRLLTAIKNESFEFYYQPFVDTKSGLISGAEALIRWVEADGNIIYPDSFIPFSEKLGLIDQLDKIAINKVFAQVALWQKQALDFGPIAINLSAKMFSDSAALIALLKAKLNQYGISPARIKIEITEGMLLDKIDIAILTMQQLKALGFKLSLDDFGTGFSSLSYLKQFPIDILKIDRSFIMGMHESSIDQSIVRSIINLANNLNLSVIAEGVELSEHLAFLQQLNCQEYQGYYFSKAISFKELEQLVMTQIKTL